MKKIILTGLLFLGLILSSCEKAIHTDHIYSIVNMSDKDLSIKYKMFGDETITETQLSSIGSMRLKVFHADNRLEDAYEGDKITDQVELLIINGINEDGSYINISDGLLNLNRWELFSFSDDHHLNHCYDLVITNEDF